VQAKSTAESTHLIASMQRTASMAKQFGLSLDEVLGYTAAISEKTMLPGEVIGTSMKTIIERSQRLKTLQELSKMQPFQNTQFINPFTGDMMKANNVLALVAKSWKTMTDEQQKSVGELIAGGRQVNTFIALMENYDRALNLTKESMSSWGYAAKANETEMQKFSKTWAKFRGMMIEQSGAGAMAPFIGVMQTVIGLLNKAAGAAYETGLIFGTLAMSLIGGAGVAFAVNKVSLALAAYSATATVATVGTNALSIAFKALGISVGAGWVGLITAGVTAIIAGYYSWTSHTEKQTEEQNALNKSLSETADKIQNIIKAIPKTGMKTAIQQSVEVVKNMSEADINAYINSGGKLATTPEGERYIPVGAERTSTVFSKIQKGTQTLAPEEQKIAQQLYDSFNRQFLDKMGGISEANITAFFEEVNKVRDVGFENDIKNHLRIMEESKDTIRWPQESKVIFEKWKKTRDLLSLTLQEQIAIFNAHQKYMAPEENSNYIYKIGASITGASKDVISPAYFQEIGDKVTSQMFKGLSDNFIKYLSTMEGFTTFSKKETPAIAQNMFAQRAMSSKYQTDALNAYIEEITSKTQQSLRGTTTPKFKMEFDYAAIETATKEYQDLNTKIKEIDVSMANIKKLEALNLSGVFDSEAAKKYTDDMAKLTQTKKEYVAELQTAEQGLVIFNSLLVMNSQSASETDKRMASLTYSILTGQDAIGNIIKLISDATNQFISLNSWVQNVISSLLSIPKSISIQINAALGALGGSSIGGFVSNAASSLMGGLFKGLIPSGTDSLGTSEERVFRTKTADIKKEAESLTQIGKQIKDNSKEYYKAFQYRKGMAEIEKEFETLTQKRYSAGLTQDEEKSYNALAESIEKARKSSQKDSGESVAKRESEDKAHQTALERIHQIEQQISVQKKVQSFWENQLTDNVKRRWEREIKDLKSRSENYVELSKVQGLKPEEVRQYERQARETSDEAKLMEDKRGEIEKQYQTEIAQKRFNRTLEETNKLFEYQQQIKSLDFESRYTIDDEQKKFQIMQQEEKVQFAISQYSSIYVNERSRLLELIRQEQSGQGEITTEIEARIQSQVEEQMLLNENVQKAKERVIEEQRATVILDKRLRNEAIAKAKQSVSEIQSTLASSINSLFDSKTAEDKLKRIKDIMEEISGLQRDSETASYGIAEAETTGNIESINQAREKWNDVNQQMAEARKKLDEVDESTNKWKETLRSISDTVLKKISEKIADMLVNKTGLGESLMGTFMGIEGFGKNKTTNRGIEGLLAAGLPVSGSLMGGIGTSLGNGGFAPTLGATTINVTQATAGSGGLAGSLLGGIGGFDFGKTSSPKASSAAKYGTSSYLTSALLGYSIGSATKNRAVGAIGGGIAGFLTGGPVGAVLGALGGLFGGGGDEEEKKPEPVAREFYPLFKNTESLDRNTSALMKLSEGVFNAPSAFEFNKAQAENNATSITNNFTINATGANAKSIATEVNQAISKSYKSSMGKISTVTSNWG
jgi:hypothetical protein